MNNLNTRNWYLLASKPHQEERACTNLAEQGYQVYLPLVHRERRHMGKSRVKTEALFTRYLFICLDRENDNWAPIRYTHGVSGLVGFGSNCTNYIPVPEDVISRIKAHEDPHGVHQLERAEWFRKGDNIRITSGPFAEIQGIFVTDDGLNRSMILIEMLGKQQHVAVQSSQLAAAR
ncbi:MAG: transcription/translation regulatory transformer protein RfaH [Gammaproteobacteria bacterium]|jgi:transcriptional antiterminator RfaH|nr:transcription/translation regulatory transformer protein RfaH [Gammaproteobacteria bacterium]